WLRIIDDDHAAGAEHRTLCDEALVIHQRRVGLFHVLDRNRCTTWNHRLEFPTVERTSTEIVEEFLDWKAHHDFVSARPLHVAAHREELGSGALGARERHLLVPLRAVEENRRRGNERL